MPALIGGETWAAIRARIEEIFTAAGTISANLAAALAAKTAAETAQTNASGSATSASTSASAAAGSAGSASAAASAASGSAGAAASAATTAGAHMSNASTQAANAAASATAAANVYDAFDDRYLGAKPSNPALDNDGNTLIVGALFFHTGSGEIRVWNGAAWQTAFVPAATYMQRAQNLADVASPAAALSNLGLTATAAEVNVLHNADASLLPILAAVPRAVIAAFSNPIINGTFSMWQRGITNTTALGYFADRWISFGGGGTITASQQTFALGDTLGPHQPRLHMRQTVSGQTLASQVAGVAQRIEDVRRFAGRKVTVMGWARRSSGSGNMAVNFQQSFGTGGSPSAAVGTAGKVVALTALWAPFAIDIDIPGIVGKTFGTNNDDFTTLSFYTSAGGNFSVPAANLGLQTIGVDLWGIHIRDGLVPVAATDFFLPRSRADLTAEGMRFYETGTMLLQAGSVGLVANTVQFSTRKREIPTTTFTTGGNSLFNTGSITVQGASDRSISYNGSATGAGGYAFVNWTADAEL